MTNKHCHINDNKESDIFDMFDTYSKIQLRGKKAPKTPIYR